MSNPAAPDARNEVAGVDPAAELLGLAVTILDVLALHPLLSLLGGPAADGTAQVALWPFIALALLARAVVWGLEQRGVRGPGYTAVIGAAGLASITALVGLVLLPSYTESTSFLTVLTRPGGIGLGLLSTVLAGGFIWWRSLRGGAPGVAVVYGRFERIMGLYLGYVFIAWLGRAGFLTPVFTRDLFAVFLVGLWAMALARSRLEGERSHQVLSLRWFVFSLGLIGGVLGVGLLFAGLFSQDLVAALFAPVSAAAQLLGLVTVLTAQAFAYMVFIALAFLLAGVRMGSPPTQPVVLPLGPPRDPLVDDLLAQAAKRFGLDETALQMIGGLIILAVFAWLAWRVLGSAQHRRRALGGGTRESLLDWGALWGGLVPHRAARPQEADPLLALTGNPAYRYTVRVRQAYRRALAVAAGQGVNRLPYQTADEVLPALQGALPTGRDPLASLTAVYDATRYTATPATAADAMAAEQALAALTTGAPASARRQDRRGAPRGKE
ncbi:MAG TPA: DUF4129 domain-containing protein [Chloroflexia bacterium]|nr:DUF4129 domain-containing protein [Chloroflexia bacterium]